MTMEAVRPEVFPDRAALVIALQGVVRAELSHWVPDASQGVVRRASVMLSQPVPPVQQAPDCGPDRAAHCTYYEWVAGLYLIRCAPCGRLFYP